MELREEEPLAVTAEADRSVSAPMLSVVMRDLMSAAAPGPFKTPIYHVSHLLRQ